ncbi:hypothetical protein B0H11DRAFT_2207354 [Mycena galericulata]|nr:hypothetical protein B0H11DRAFT_2207354 [Mycena galericulata]
MSHMLIKSEISPPTSPLPTREPRSTAVLTGQITHNLFNGGALDSQVSDSQFVDRMIEQHTSRSSEATSGQITHSSFNGGFLDDQGSVTEQRATSPSSTDEDTKQDASFTSADSSDTACEPYTIWVSAHSQGDNEPYDFRKDYGAPANIPVDDPMDDCPFHPSRPSTPQIIARYANLKPEDIRLSDTEARIIAAVRADRDYHLAQYVFQEQITYRDIVEAHNQSARIAALESLLEYHRIPLPA